MTNNSNIENVHKPVLVKEVVELLTKNIARLQDFKIIDATIGFGGHSVEFIKKGCRILGIDADRKALEFAKINLESACPAPKNFRSIFTLVNGNFRDIYKISIENGFLNADAILFDLGANTEQLMSKSRGFSFTNPNAHLDMRLDPQDQAVKASDLLNTLDKHNLMSLFSVSLEYKEAQYLIDKIIKARENKPFVFVGDLLSIIENDKVKLRKINPATKIFMALRIAVNSELDNITEALSKSLNLIKSEGRIAVISFHSGEDKIVKTVFNRWAFNGLVKIITKKPIIPTPAELLHNPRSRSTKLRIIERL